MVATLLLRLWRPVHSCKLLLDPMVVANAQRGAAGYTTAAPSMGPPRRKLRWLSS